MILCIQRFNTALGHGRRLETFFACVGITLGFMMTYREVVVDSSTFHQLGYQVYPLALSLPWLLYGVLGFIGVLGNVFAWPKSRIFRLLASLVGITLWSWVTLVNIFKGDLFSTMTAFSFWFAVFSLGTLRTAYLNLPVPGDPGRWY